MQSPEAMAKQQTHNPSYWQGIYVSFSLKVDVFIKQSICSFEHDYFGNSKGSLVQFDIHAS